MLDVNPALEAKSNQDDAVVTQTKNDAPVWEAPKLEDVSEQVMAQPYIRFT